jgi:SAM-dependent methyltransferase
VLTVDYDRLGLEPGELLLDLGCGAGRHAYGALRRGARVIAVDRAADEVRQVRFMIAAMHAKGELEALGSGCVQADALALPFAEATFDRVVVSEVLEHVPDDAAAIAELARVLAPGGTLAVSVPRAWPEAVNWALSREYHDVPGGHVRIYRRSVLWSRLRAAGLEVVGSHHAHALHSPYWWLRCLVGPSRDDHPLVAAYHRLLVWDIERRPFVTRAAERLLDPLMGKSLVVYCTKPRSTDAARRARHPTRRAERSRDVAILAARDAGATRRAGHVARGDAASMAGSPAPGDRCSA